MLQAPLPAEESAAVELAYGPNIVAIPEFEALPDELRVPVLLKVGDDISTDEIMPAGARVLPFRSNIPAISQFVFEQFDPTYVQRAQDRRDGEGHAIVAGRNYGQGSSREHAALAPRYLGLRVVVAISFARIHWQNLVNFGILPLTFDNPADYDTTAPEDELQITGILDSLSAGSSISLFNVTQQKTFATTHTLSPRQVEMIRAGGLINWVRNRR